MDVESQSFSCDHRREEFLKLFGGTYQPAPETCLSLSRLHFEWASIKDGGKDFWVGAQWGGVFQSSNGAIRVQLTSHHKHLFVELRESPRLQKAVYGKRWFQEPIHEILQPGDQIALFCSRKGAHLGVQSLFLRETPEVVVLAPRKRATHLSKEPRSS